MALVDWSCVYLSRDLDEAVLHFTNSFNRILNIHAPWIKFQKRKNFSPWLTKSTIELMNQRDKAKQKYEMLVTSSSCRDDQVEAWQDFKKLRNTVNNRKKYEEINYKKEKMVSSLDDPAKMWRASKEVMEWRSVGSPSRIEVDNCLITSARSIAEHMNNFFIEKVRKIKSGMQTLTLSLNSCKLIMEGKQCHLNLSFVTVEKVEKMLRKLSNSKCTSIDGLDNFSVKLAAKVIAPPLHHLITLSLMQQSFPSSWKFSKIIPLQKNVKLSPLEMKNYRPVAILSPVSKVLEKLIYEQIYGYFTRNKIFHQNLHGYRSNRSTQTALLQMYTQWVQAANSGHISGAVLLDMSAAFDLVSHDLLLQKLEVYGLRPDFLQWIKSYLLNRYQGVWIDYTLSSYLPCDIGVPQGSILGPLFFLLFVNDLPTILDNTMEQYADDSTLTAVGSSVTEVNVKLTSDCNNVKKWMEQNQLKLNPDKTHVMTLGTQRRLDLLDSRVSFDMDGVNLQESPDGYELLLGCFIQSNLKWKKHITELTSKLKKRLTGLACIKYLLPKHLKKVLA